MKHFFIGDGSFAREIYENQKYFEINNFSGFISFSKNKKKIQFKNFLQTKNKTLYSITIGNSLIREKIHKELLKNKFLINKSIIFNDTKISSRVKIKSGSIIMNNVILANDVKVGKNVIIHPNCVIGHNVSIGDNVTIGAGVFIGGHAQIGKNCTINPSAVIIKKIKITRNCTIGAGSVVINDLRKKTNVFGIPAKNII